MSTENIITILSMITAIIVSIAEFVWSKNYRAAKDAEISSKDAQIASVERELTSVKRASEDMERIKEERINQLREFIDQLREKTPEKIYNQFLEAQKGFDLIMDRKVKEIEELKNESRRKDEEIINYKKLGIAAQESIEFMSNEKRRIENKLRETESELIRMRYVKLSDKELERFSEFTVTSGSVFVTPGAVATISKINPNEEDSND